MASFADTFTASVDAVVSATADLAEVSALAGQLDNDVLIESQRALAQARRNLDVAAARLAGETARRSDRAAGLAGLAQKEGFRTPEALIRNITGSTGREAVTLVRVGALLHDASMDDGTDTSGGERVPSSDRPWLVAIGVEVAAGRLSVDAAEAIRAGLGVPDAGVTAEELAEAARTIAAGAQGLDADELYRRARNVRDDLDEAGIAARAKAQRDQRSLRRWRKPDGMTRYTWELDPEGAALVDGVYDQLTSPRRGGPRMVDEAERARVEAIDQDPRTTEQLASDGLLQLVTIAVGADPSQIIGRAQPAVWSVPTASPTAPDTAASRAIPTPSPSRPWNESRAPLAPCRSFSTSTAKPSTSGANIACSLAARKTLWQPGMADAAGPAAKDRRPGPKRITSNTGNAPTVPPIWRTGSCSADITTCCSTTTIGRSAETVMAATG